MNNFHRDHRKEVLGGHFRNLPHPPNAVSVKKNYEIVPKTFLWSKSLGHPAFTAPLRQCLPSVQVPCLAM
jgi:hypothetical protein